MAQTGIKRIELKSNCSGCNKEYAAAITEYKKSGRLIMAQVVIIVNIGHGDYMAFFCPTCGKIVEINQEGGQDER